MFSSNGFMYPLCLCICRTIEGFAEDDELNDELNDSALLEIWSTPPESLTGTTGCRTALESNPSKAFLFTGTPWHENVLKTSVFPRGELLWFWWSSKLAIDTFYASADHYDVNSLSLGNSVLPPGTKTPGRKMKADCWSSLAPFLLSYLHKTLNEWIRSQCVLCWW